MSKWINVKTRLPPLDKTVLVCRRRFDGHPVYHWGARIDDGEGWLWGVGGRFGIEPNDDATCNDIEADDDYQVTHWQTLPRAPFRKPVTRQERSTDAADR